MRIWLMAAALVFSQAESKESIPTLTVQGQASVRKNPDLLRIRFTTVTEAKDALSALNDNNLKMNALVKAMKGAGLNESELETGSFSITPVYSTPPGNSSEAFVSEIRAFRISNTLSLQTNKLDSAGDLIDRAAKAGSNSIDSIQFALQDPNELKIEAVQAAAKNAISNANALAAASHISLKRILSINLDNANQDPFPRPRALFSMQEASFQNTPILSGQVESEANVTISFEIENSR